MHPYNFGEFSNASTGFAAVIAAFFISMIFFFIAVAAILFIARIVGLWKVFEKAGEDGWKSIIPIYNEIIVLKIVGLQWYYIFGYVLFSVPFIGSLAGTAYSFYITYLLSKSFKKNDLFAVGLFFLHPIFIVLLGFDKSKYDGPVLKGDIDFNNLFKQ